MLFDWIRELITMFADYLKPWILVNHSEKAVVLRFGRFHRTLSPGIYLKIPLAEFFYVIDVKTETMDIKPLNINTLDNKTISIGLMVQYEIDNPMLFLIENNDSVSNMKDICRGEMSDYLEDVNWEDIKKKTTKNALRKLLIPKMEEMGVKLLDIKFTDKALTKVLSITSHTPSIL